MMGAAVLKHHKFVWSLWALYRLVVSSITFVRHLYVEGSGAAHVNVLKTFRANMCRCCDKQVHRGVWEVEYVLKSCHCKTLM